MRIPVNTIDRRRTSLQLVAMNVACWAGVGFLFSTPRTGPAFVLMPLAAALSISTVRVLRRGLIIETDRVSQVGLFGTAELPGVTPERLETVSDRVGSRHNQTLCLTLSNGLSWKVASCSRPEDHSCIEGAMSQIREIAPRLLRPT